MIKNLITACLIATTKVVTPYTPVDQQPNNTEGQQIKLVEHTTGYQTYTETLYGQTIVTFTDNGTHIETSLFEMDSVTLYWPDELGSSTYNEYATYYRIKPKSDITPPSWTIQINPTFVLTGEEQTTTTVERAIEINGNINYDWALNLDNLQQYDYYTNFIYDRYNTQIDQFNTEEDWYITDKTYSYQVDISNVQADGYIRVAINYMFNSPNYQTVSLSELSTKYNVYVPTYEVIDLPGLMFTILGMPFSFFSQAFNLTLFPNTPYSINVSNLIFALITALLVIFIFKKLWGK